MNKWDRDLVDRVIAQSRKIGRSKPMLIVGPKTAELLIEIGFKREQFIIDQPVTQATLDEWRAQIFEKFGVDPEHLRGALMSAIEVRERAAEAMKEIRHIQSGDIKHGCRHGDCYPLYCPYCKEIARAGKEYEKSCFPDYLQGVPHE
jgi:endonuclease III